MKRKLCCILGVSLASWMVAGNAMAHDEPESLSSYKSNYIVFEGVEEIKFQISFKYQMFGAGGADSLGGMVDAVPLVNLPGKAIADFSRNWYFSYSQKSFWDIGEPSAPFSDHNFNPSVFYQIETADKSTVWEFSPIEHESNGQDSDMSRSWNRSYVSASHVSGKWDLYAKGWGIWQRSGNNRDIKDYQGFGEVMVAVNTTDAVKGERTQDRNMRLELRARKGLESNNGNIQVDASVPYACIRKLWSSNEKKRTFNPHFLLQVFAGEGEKMLAYNEDVLEVRGGLFFHF